MRVCVRAVRCSLYTRRVHACCYWLSAKSGKILQDYNEKLVSVVDAVCTKFPVAISTSLTLIPPILVLPKMTNSTTLGLVTSLKMMVMVVGVLNFAVAQGTPPSENVTIQRIFGLQDPVCCFCGSLLSMECKVLRVLQHVEDS